MRFKKSAGLLFSVLCFTLAPAMLTPQAFIDNHSDASADAAVKSHSAADVVTQFDNTHLRQGPATSYDITGYANKGETFNVISTKDNWYKVKNKDMSGYVLKRFVGNHNQSSVAGLTNKTIVIDAGHGGVDAGATGASGTHEKDFTERTVHKLSQKLTILGAEVILTREADRFVSLASRTSLSNITDADAFISIHYNSFPQQPSVTGIGTYYYHKQSRALARSVQEGLIHKTGANDRKALKKDYYVIRQNIKPAILVELGFISNPEIEQLLMTNERHEQLVSGIVSGLTNYFN